MQARDQDEGLPGCCPLVTLGTMDIMGDTMIGPPIPYCGVCGGAPEPENRDTKRTAALVIVRALALAAPCVFAIRYSSPCRSSGLMYSALDPIGAAGRVPCDDYGGGKYSRTWWYTD